MAAGNGACGLSVEGEIECWGNCSDFRIPSGDNYTEIAVYSQGVCGLRDGGLIKCSEIDLFGWNDPLFFDYSYIQLDAYFETICALTDDNRVSCKSRPHYNPCGNSYCDGCSQIAVGHLNICFLKEDGDVECSQCLRAK